MTSDPYTPEEVADEIEERVSIKVESGIPERDAIDEARREQVAVMAWRASKQRD